MRSESEEGRVASPAKGEVEDRENGLQKVSVFISSCLLSFIGNEDAIRSISHPPKGSSFSMVSSFFSSKPSVFLLFPLLPNSKLDELPQCRAIKERVLKKLSELNSSDMGSSLIAFAISG